MYPRSVTLYHRHGQRANDDRMTITLITDGREASPYVTLKPASLAACAAHRGVRHRLLSSARCVTTKSYQSSSGSYANNLEAHPDARRLHVEADVAGRAALR